MEPETRMMKDNPPTLEEAQAFVRGWIEVVFLPNGDQMVVNEEGMIKDMPINTVASVMARQHIFGPALVLHGPARLD